MTARKNTKSEQDNTETVGKDESKTTQTTKQAEDNEVASSAEKREADQEDVRASAGGSNVGGTVDGENFAVDEDSEVDEGDFEDGGNFEGALGTVAERNINGDEYDAPYTYLTASDLAPARTSDSDDPARDWTAQHAGGERQDEDGNDLDPVALVPVQQTPGQTFRLRELPNREVAEAAGVDYDQWVAGLPVRVDVPDEAPRKGIPA